MRMDLESLQAERRKLRAALTGLGSLRRGRKRKQSRSSSEWRLSRRMKHTAIICYVASEYDAGAAVQYLAAVGRQWHWQDIGGKTLASEDESQHKHITSTPAR